MPLKSKYWANTGIALLLVFCTTAASFSLEAAATEKTCQFSDTERRFMEIFHADKLQNRKSITCDPRLLTLARSRAEDMAKRSYFSHTNPDGHGPNYLLTMLGYVLPDFWDKTGSANYIESIYYGSGGNRGTPEDAYDTWMHSSGHRRHVLAEDEFYSTQSVAAVGHYANGETHYWVFISAPPEPKPQTTKAKKAATGMKE